MSTAGTVDQVERLCREPLTPKALRERCLEVVRRAVPFDAHVWLLTDPVSRVGTSPLAHVPMLEWAELPRLTLERYRAAPVDWAQPTRWRRLLEAMGVTDVATSDHADRFGTWAWLDVWRCGGTFSAAERSLLARLAEPLAAGLRAAQARTFVADTEPLALAGPAVVLLDAELRIVGQTATAGAALTELNPPGEAPVPSPIPAAALNVAAALLAGGPAWSRVHLGAGRWVTLRAEEMSGEPAVAVTIEASTVAERREVYALAHGLTPREREVLTQLATGADSRTLARRLALSEHTVNDHVRALLAKCGAPTRAVLLARVAGD